MMSDEITPNPRQDQRCEEIPLFYVPTVASDDILKVARCAIAEGQDVHSRVLAAISELSTGASFPHSPILGVNFRHVAPTAGSGLGAVPERYVSPPNVPSLDAFPPLLGGVLQGESLRAAATVRLQLREAGLYCTPGRSSQPTSTDATQEASSENPQPSPGKAVGILCDAIATSPVLDPSHSLSTVTPSLVYKNPNFVSLQTRLRAANRATLNLTHASSASISSSPNVASNLVSLSQGPIDSRAEVVASNTAADLSSLVGESQSVGCFEEGGGGRVC